MEEEGINAHNCFRAFERIHADAVHDDLNLSPILHPWAKARGFPLMPMPLTMSAIGTKRTSLVATHMSAFEVERTCRFALQMAAYDPKRTLPSRKGLLRIVPP